MERLIPNTEEIYKDKHIPVVEVIENIALIKIGGEMHPHTYEHHVKFIVVETNKRIARKNLNPEEEPVFKMCLCRDEKILRVYEYCNIHGLFVKEL